MYTGVVHVREPGRERDAGVAALVRGARRVACRGVFSARVDARYRSRPRDKTFL